MPRHDGRKSAELRSVAIIRRYTEFAPGSVLIQCGATRVLCTASFQNGAPPWKQGQGTGWVTAEYDMLPGATPERRPRNRHRVDGRTQEIQRLIGRSLRAVVDLAALGEHTVVIDCDVLQADGGTRTAAVTGAYVALCDAVKHARTSKLIRKSPIRDSVAAISVGIVNDRVLLDLDYVEDSSAEVDLNVVMTGSNRFVEVQGTAEARPFSGADLDRMLRAASRGIKRLSGMQRRALRQKV